MNTGIFKVPVNTAGEYILTFTVTILTPLTPLYYLIAKNGRQLGGTEIYANIGTDR